MIINKYNAGGRTPRYNMGGGMPPQPGQMQGQPGQMQGGPEGGGGAPPEVTMLLEMLDQFGIPDEITVGEIKEKLLKRGGETPGVNIPPSPSMPMQ